MTSEDKIKQMRDREPGIQDWDKRGIAVGEEVWAVLQRWYETAKVEKMPAQEDQ